MLIVRFPCVSSDAPFEARPDENVLRVFPTSMLLQTFSVPLSLPPPPLPSLHGDKLQMAVVPQHTTVPSWIVWLCMSQCVPSRSHRKKSLPRFTWGHTIGCIRRTQFSPRLMCPSITGLQELTPESLTCALDRSERTTLYHTLRASGSRRLEEGSPKRMNCGI